MPIHKKLLNGSPSRESWSQADALFTLSRVFVHGAVKLFSRSDLLPWLPAEFGRLSNVVAFFHVICFSIYQWLPAKHEISYGWHVAFFFVICSSSIVCTMSRLVFCLLPWQISSGCMGIPVHVLEVGEFRT